MKRAEADEEIALPEQYERALDLRLLTGSIVTMDSYRQPIYEGQLVSVTIKGVRYFARASEHDSINNAVWPGFIILTSDELGGSAYRVRDVEWAERLSASDETIARLGGGRGVK